MDFQDSTTEDQVFPGLVQETLSLNTLGQTNELRTILKISLHCKIKVKKSKNQILKMNLNFFKVKESSLSREISTLYSEK